MSLQNIAHRPVGNLMTEISQCAHDPIVAPTGILFGHLHNQRFQLRFDSRPAGVAAVFGAIELPGDKPPVPSQNGVRFGDARHLGQSLPAEPFTDLGQGGSFGVGQAQSGGEVFPQNSILRREILVLQQQFLVYQAGHVRQQAYPLGFFHLEWP